MMPLFRHLLEHFNKWTHSWKHINMAFQNRFYFLDKSPSCWEIPVDALVELGRLWIPWSLSATHKNSYHTFNNISATGWDIMEIKPVPKSHINMLSEMGSLDEMLQEMPEWWHHENENPISLFFVSPCTLRSSVPLHPCLFLFLERHHYSTFVILINLLPTFIYWANSL